MDAPIIEDRANGSNTARFIFFNPAAEEFLPDWDRVANEVVATLRGYAGQCPRDKTMTDLIGELVTRSDDFCTRWSRHDVRFHRLGVKRIHHPIVGDLELDYDALDLPRTRTGSCSRTRPSPAALARSGSNCWAASPRPARPVLSSRTRTAMVEAER